MQDDDRNYRLNFNGNDLQGNRYLELKESRKALTEEYIRAGKVDAIGSQRHFDDATNFVGECTEMCPVFERHEREYEKTVDKYEMLENSGTSGSPIRIDHSKAVKRYRRSAAGDDPPLPCDVRTPETLLKTLDYIINSILGVYGIRQDSHLFLWDRTRGINKDFQLQNWRGPERIIACEKICRYLAISIHAQNLQNWEMPVFNLKKPVYDPKQDFEQLCKVLLTLLELYDDPDRQIRSPNEAEFRAYSIYAHLLEPLPSELEKLPDDVFEHPRLQRAIRFHALASQFYGQDHGRSLRYSESAQNAFHRFFHAVRTELITGESYAEGCLLELSFNAVRRGALWTLNSACMVRYGHPINEIVKKLAFDSPKEAVWFAHQYGIQPLPNKPTHLSLGKGSARAWRESSERLFTPHSGIVNQLLGQFTLVDVVHGIGEAHSSNVDLYMRSKNLKISDTLPSFSNAIAFKPSITGTSSSASSGFNPKTIPPSSLPGSSAFIPANRFDNVSPSAVPHSVAATNVHSFQNTNANAMRKSEETQSGPVFAFKAQPNFTAPSIETTSLPQNAPAKEPVESVKPIPDKDTKSEHVIQRPLAEKVAVKQAKKVEIPVALMQLLIDKFVEQEVKDQIYYITPQIEAWWSFLKLHATGIAESLVRQVCLEESRFSLVQGLMHQQALESNMKETAQIGVALGVLDSVVKEIAADVLLNEVNMLQSDLYYRYCIAKRFVRAVAVVSKRQRRATMLKNEEQAHRSQLLKTVSALGFASLSDVQSDLTPSAVNWKVAADVIPDTQLVEPIKQPSSSISLNSLFVAFIDRLKVIDSVTLPVNLDKFAKVALLTRAPPRDTFDLFSHRSLFVHEWVCRNFLLDTAVRKEQETKVLRLDGQFEIVLSHCVESNFKKSCRGVSIVIVSLEPYTEPFHQSIDKWWQRQSKSIGRVCVSLPHGTRVKLLLLFFETPDSSLSFSRVSTAPDITAFCQRFEKDTLSIRLVPLCVLLESKCAPKADERLLSDLTETFLEANFVPQIDYRFEEQVFQQFVAPTWSETLSEMHRVLSQGIAKLGNHNRRILSLETQVALFNFVLKSWNGLLDLSLFLLADEETTKLDWPPVEIAGKPCVNKPNLSSTVPDLQWNSPDNLRKVSQFVNAYKVCLINYKDKFGKLDWENAELKREGVIYDIAQSFMSTVPAAFASNAAEKVWHVFQSLDKILIYDRSLERDDDSYIEKIVERPFKAFEEILQCWTNLFFGNFSAEFNYRVFYFKKKARAAGLAYQRQSQKSLAQLVRTILATDLLPRAHENSSSAMLLSTPKRALYGDSLLSDEPSFSTVSLAPYESSIGAPSELSFDHYDDGMSVVSSASSIVNGMSSVMSIASTCRSLKRKRKYDKAQKLAEGVRRQQESLSKALKNLEEATKKAQQFINS